MFSITICSNIIIKILKKIINISSWLISFNFFFLKGINEKVYVGIESVISFAIANIDAMFTYIGTCLLAFPDMNLNLDG